MGPVFGIMKVTKNPLFMSLVQSFILVTFNSSKILDFDIVGGPFLWTTNTQASAKLTAKTMGGTRFASRAPFTFNRHPAASPLLYSQSSPVYNTALEALAETCS